MPIPRQPALASTNPAVCPIGDRVCAEVVSLPIYPALSDDQVSAVMGAFSSFVPPAREAPGHDRAGDV